MENQVPLAKICEDWAETVFKIWFEKMSSLGIRHDPESFVHHLITSTGGDVSRIELMFNYYLKFTDMGVGKGVRLLNRPANTTRKQKPWYTQTFLLEVKKLANIIAANYARNSAIMIVENMDDNALKHTPQKI